MAASCGFVFTIALTTTRNRMIRPLTTVEVTAAPLLRVPSSSTPKWLKLGSFGLGSLLTSGFGMCCAGP